MDWLNTSSNLIFYGTSTHVMDQSNQWTVYYCVINMLLIYLYLQCILKSFIK